MHAGTPFHVQASTQKQQQWKYPTPTTNQLSGDCINSYGVGDCTLCKCHRVASNLFHGGEDSDTTQRKHTHNGKHTRTLTATSSRTPNWTGDHEQKRKSHADGNQFPSEWRPVRGTTAEILP